jgi:hypothetical protein
MFQNLLPTRILVPEGDFSLEILWLMNAPLPGLACFSVLFSLWFDNLFQSDAQL